MIRELAHSSQNLAASDLTHQFAIRIDNRTASLALVQHVRCNVDNVVARAGAGDIDSNHMLVNLADFRLIVCCGEDAPQAVELRQNPEQVTQRVNDTYSGHAVFNYQVNRLEQ